MARSDASSDEERSPRVNGKGKEKKQPVSDSESEIEVSEDDENDSEATKMHKRTAREGKARAQLRQKYRRLQATADGDQLFPFPGLEKQMLTKFPYDSQVIEEI